MLKSAVGLCACGLLFAQDTPPDPEAVLSAQDQHMGALASAWLHSADPRLQAWGAYIVLRDRHTGAIPDLLGMVDRFAVVEQVASQAELDQHDAMLGVLDALIQFGAPVPAVDAARIYPEFPVQALILLSRSQEDPSPSLLEIFKSEQRWPAAWLAAGALLLEHRAEGFAAALIESLTVHAEIMVTEPDTGFGHGGSAMCCGGSPGPQPKSGWPPLGVYGFAGCGDRLQPGALVLAGGPDPTYYNRQADMSYQESVSSCGCNPDRDLARQHYLTNLLYASPEQPPVRAHVSHTIVWQGPEAYRSELTTFIGEQQKVLEELAKRLGQQNLLNESDARSLRPRLRITLWDQRASPKPALPAIAMPAENISLERF